MDKDEIVVIDNNFRFPVDQDQERLDREYSEQKLKEAEERENERLERSYQKMINRQEKFKKLMNGIKNIFKKQSQTKQQQTTQSNER
ncbi:MAG: hypothetical protein UIH99_02125 [Alphaproteobacteria bacterium]|nr:hypothetical protein [Alphaproteobacteria bacterium]